MWCLSRCIYCWPWCLSCIESLSRHPNNLFNTEKIRNPLLIKLLPSLSHTLTVDKSISATFFAWPHRFTFLSPKVRYTLFANTANREWNHFFAEQNIVRENRANVLLYTVRCSPNKIFFAKTGQMSCYTLFVVHRQFLHEHIRHWEFLFFHEKLLYVPRRDCYLKANLANSLWRKTCSQNMVRTYYTLFAVCPYFIISSLFRCCWIVYRLA